MPRVFDDNRKRKKKPFDDDAFRPRAAVGTRASDFEFPDVASAPAIEKVLPDFRVARGGPVRPLETETLSRAREAEEAAFGRTMQAEAEGAARGIASAKTGIAATFAAHQDTRDMLAIVAEARTNPTGSKTKAAVDALTSFAYEDIYFPGGEIGGQSHQTLTSIKRINNLLLGGHITLPEAVDKIEPLRQQLERTARRREAREAVVRNGEFLDASVEDAKFSVDQARNDVANAETRIDEIQGRIDQAGKEDVPDSNTMALLNRELADANDSLRLLRDTAVEADAAFTRTRQDRLASLGPRGAAGEPGDIHGEFAATTRRLAELRAGSPGEQAAFDRARALPGAGTPLGGISDEDRAILGLPSNEIERDITPQGGARKKGPGFLGELKRPDGRVSTELSIGVEVDDRQIEIPSLVPTLTQEEVRQLLSGGEVSDAVVKKAVDHAMLRISQGKSPFAKAGEAVAPGVDDPVSDRFKAKLAEISARAAKRREDIAAGIVAVPDEAKKRRIRLEERAKIKAARTPAEKKEIIERMRARLKGEKTPLMRRKEEIADYDKFAAAGVDPSKELLKIDKDNNTVLNNRLARIKRAMPDAQGAKARRLQKEFDKVTKQLEKKLAAQGQVIETREAAEAEKDEARLDLAKKTHQLSVDRYEQAIDEGNRDRIDRAERDRENAEAKLKAAQKFVDDRKAAAALLAKKQIKITAKKEVVTTEKKLKVDADARLELGIDNIETEITNDEWIIKDSRAEIKDLTAMRDVAEDEEAHVQLVAGTKKLIKDARARISVMRRTIILFRMVRAAGAKPLTLTPKQEELYKKLSERQKRSLGAIRAAAKRVGE